MTLTRSRSERMIAGVCGGIARYYGWRTRNLRIAFVVSCLLPGPQVVMYLLLWFVMPDDDRPRSVYR